MTALQMKYRLRQLERQRGVGTAAPVPVPMTDPVAGPQVLEGFASTPDVDADRMVFPPGSLEWPVLPKLLWKHRDDEIAGTVDHLRYDLAGRLRIVATVGHELGRRAPAFSIGAKVLDYKIVDVDTPNFHALVTRAILHEISLTDLPANRFAVVAKRAPYKTPAVVQFFDLLSDHVGILMRLTQFITDQHRHCNDHCDDPRPAQHAPASPWGDGCAPPAFLLRKS
jgi:hypothetical protein